MFVQVHNQHQLTACGSTSANPFPTPIDSRAVLNETKQVNLDLGLMANIALAQTQVINNETRRQQYNEG